MDKLHVMAEALMEYETIDAGQIDQIMAGRKPVRRTVGAMMTSRKATRLMLMMICKKRRLTKSQAHLRRATRRRLINRDSKAHLARSGVRGPQIMSILNITPTRFLMVARFIRMNSDLIVC